MLMIIAVEQKGETMTRIEENSITRKEVAESIEELLKNCDRPNDGIQPGEFLMSGIETAKIMVLIDISKSLAMLADGLED